MRIKAIAGIMLTLLLATMLSAALNVTLVKASSTVYWVKAGAVGNGTSETTPAGNITYVLTTYALSFGDVIKVKPGTYDTAAGEVFPITINVAGLTVESTGGAGVTIVNASFAGHGFKVTASNVTISGFRIIKADNQQPGYAGAYAAISFESAAGLDNGTVTNNIIEDCNFGVMVSGVGQYWKPFNNFVISYNNMSGITRLGVFGGWQTSNNWLIEHNDIQGGYEQGIELDNGNNNIIRYNKVHNVSLVGIYLVYMMNTQVYGNEMWGMTGHTVQYPGQPYYPDAADGIQVLGLDGRNESNIIWDNYSHDNNRAGVYIGRDPGFSVSSNYNQVYNNTLEDNKYGILLGKYAISTLVKENTINNNTVGIRVEGSGDNITDNELSGNGIEIISTNDVTISGGSMTGGTVSYDTMYGTRDTMVMVDNSTDILIENLNMNASSNPTNSYGIVFENSNGTIKGCTISDVPPYKAAVAAWGGSQIEILENTVQYFGKNGMLIWGQNTRALIQGNIVRGTVYNDTSMLTNGIQISYGANATIRNNEIYDCRNLAVAPLWASIGILVYGFGVPVQEVTIDHNYIHHNEYGVWTEWGAAANTVIHCNSIMDNTEFGVYNAETDTLDAENNWWGDVKGPGNETGSAGDYVSNYVDYDPWLDWKIADLNNDWIVDIFDIIIAAAAFGSSPGDPNWNPIADLNGDNLIDIFDLVIVAVNFGKKCT